MVEGIIYSIGAGSPGVTCLPSSVRPWQTIWKRHRR